MSPFRRYPSTIAWMRSGECTSADCLPMVILRKSTGFATTAPRRRPGATYFEKLDM